ncbi:MAG: hypothetical protein AAF572_13340 [Cyanobacteria bacterium P01_B01_bin.77]
MMAPDIAREAQQAITLIKSFSLELESYGPESQVLYWLNTYRADWIRDAIIEAVYQGRYKIISVKHILSIWQRRGQPVRHFTSGFEQVIAKQVGGPLHLPTSYVSQPIDSAWVPMDEPDDDFAPSPMSSSVIATPTAEPAVLSYDHYPSLSIEAFPVESVDTLVAVYQASTSPITSPNETSHLTESSSLHGRSSAESRDAERVGMSSAPIQPFRPMARQQTYA